MILIHCIWAYIGLFWCLRHILNWELKGLKWARKDQCRIVSHGRSAKSIWGSWQQLRVTTCIAEVPHHYLSLPWHRCHIGIARKLAVRCLLRRVCLPKLCIFVLDQLLVLDSLVLSSLNMLINENHFGKYSINNLVIVKTHKCLSQVYVGSTPRLLNHYISCTTT